MLTITNELIMSKKKKTNWYFSAPNPKTETGTLFTVTKLIIIIKKL
jgi:hypothetical protein